TSLETRSVTRILAVRALRVATLRAATPASHPAPGCCGGHLPRTPNALTLSNTEDSEHVAVCTDGCETRRGHHRNWTGGSLQEPSERPPPGELVDASLWAGLEHDPAHDEVSEDLARLRDLAPQHRPPVGQAVVDLALQARDLVAADPRRGVQLDQDALATLALRLALLECRPAGRQGSAA